MSRFIIPSIAFMGVHVLLVGTVIAMSAGY